MGYIAFGGRNRYAQLQQETIETENS